MKFHHYFLSLLLVTTCSILTRAQDPNFHIYLSFGQSNMAGAGDIEAQDLANVNPRFQFMKPQDCAPQKQYAGNWYKAVPPLWGCTGGLGPSDYFGRTMVDKLPDNIKVGVVVVAIPGCKIELFGKTGYQGEDTYNYVPSNYGGSAYAWLLDLAKKAQQAGIIKGILLHQGESNGGDQQWPNKVKGVYDNLMKDLGLNPTETPLLAGELLYQEFGSCCSSFNNIIAKLPSVLPNSHVISAAKLPGKDVYHFNSAAERTFGARYANKMLSLSPPLSDISINFTSPANNSSAIQGDPITLSVSTTSTSGSISNVKFYDGTTLLTTDNSFPYSFTWTNAPLGSHAIKAVATNSTGKTTEASINIKVNVPQDPYKGITHKIPGTIQLEEFDEGGNGSAYMDSSPGSEVTPVVNFRTDEDVDIENCTDVGGGYNLAYTFAGEWLEYTVDVIKTDSYDLDIRVAKEGDGGWFHLEMDGKNITGAVTIPNTGGWQVWETVTIKDISLTEGKHTMRITFDSDYANFNYVEFKGLVTGMNNSMGDKIHFYPNPFMSAGFTIQVKGAFDYQIVDISGVVIEAGHGNNKATVGTDLRQGLYLLKVNDTVKKIIRE